MKSADVLGCKAWELEPGDEFSFDEGFSWVTAVTVCEDPRDEFTDIIVNARNDAGEVETVNFEPDRHVLLQRHWRVERRGVNQRGVRGRLTT